MRGSTIFITNLGYIANLLQTVSILMGLFTFMGGLFRLKRYSEMRTFMSYQMTLAWPLLMIIGGVSLMALPFILRTALLNTWGVTNPLRYSGDVATGFDQLIPPIIMVVRLVGVGAFIRGVLLFSRTGREGMPPGTMGKAMLHILGGVMCVHIIGTMDLMKSILGFSL